MIKIAVVGTGIIGHTHLAAIDKYDGCSLCAVCDTNEEKAREAAERYGVPYLLDYREIPEKTDATAVILNLPHFLHCEASVFFLEHGLDVLVEKPMANTVAECDKMLEAEKKSGKKLAVGHVQRFFNANRVLKEMINSGELGKLSIASERRTVNYFDDKRPEWFLHKKTAGGGIIMNYGAHALDKLMYLTGADIAEIHGIVGNIANDRDIDGHAQLFVKMSNGIYADVTLCGYNSSTYDNMYYFTGATARINDTTELSIFRDGKEEPFDCHEDGGFMYRQLVEFCRLINGEQSEIVRGDYGRQIIAAIEQVCNG